MPIRPVIFQPERVEYVHPGARAASLRAMAEQARGEQLRVDELQRKREAASQIRGVVGMYGGKITPQVAAEVSTIDPTAGMEVTKFLGEQEEQEAKGRREARLAESAALDLNLKKLSHVGGVLNTVKDEPSMHRAVGDLLSREMIPRDLAMHYLNQPWTSDLQAEIRQAVESTKTTEQQLKDQLARSKAEQEAEEAQRKAALHPAAIAKAKFDAQRAQQVVEGTQPITAEQRATIERQSATAAETGRHNVAMETAAMVRARRTGAGGGAAGGDNAALVQAIIDNPNIYDSLTPSKKTAIATDLAAAGFSGFGKQLSGTEIKEISNSKAAVKSLEDLRDVLKENEQYIGPLRGLQRLNPYSDARKAQAKIDLVRQRVGKALEGGVLRKEDEEKYKRILATLNDTPETAVAKIDGLVQTLQSDLDTYQAELRRGGRKVAAEEKPPATQQSSAGLVKLKAPNGDLRLVPADQAAHYIKMGAKKVD